MTLPRSGTMQATLLVAALSSTPLVAQTSAGSTDLQSTPAGPFARIAILHPHDGASIDFEAGYIRHLDAHRLAKDTWVWYGWSIVNQMIARTTIEILTLRPTMSYGLTPARELRVFNKGGGT